MEHETRVRRSASLSARRVAFGVILVSSTLLATGGMLLAAGSHSALAQTKEANLKLSLSGPEGTTFEGHCVITRADGEEELELSGQTPEERTFNGDGLRCTLNSSGRLTVEASKDDGNVSRTTTSGGKVTFSIR